MGGNEGKVSEGESEVGLGEREERIEEMKRKRDRGEARYEEWEEEDKRRARGERWDRIRESKYNRWYGRVKGEEGYLKKGWGRVDGEGWQGLG